MGLGPMGQAQCAGPDGTDPTAERMGRAHWPGPWAEPVGAWARPGTTALRHGQAFSKK
jgi:hypothetical protein